VLTFGFRLCLFRCRSSDSAFVRLDSATLGHIASTPVDATSAAIIIASTPLFPVPPFFTNSGSTDWDGSVFRITGGGTPVIGLNVTKVGKTTGRTDGVVLLTGLTVPILNPSRFPYVTNKVLLNQVLATYLFEHGDSGAPVFRIPPVQLVEQLISGGDATASLLGIAWLGFGELPGHLPGAVFSPISGVQSDLGPLTFAATSANPDLVAVSPFSSPGFCTVVGEGIRVAVRVANHGSTSSPGSITRVSFPPFASFDLPTPGIPAGGFVDLQPIETPPGCFNPDCGFTITVDANNNIDEGLAGEANNTVVSDCVG
jgi:hypothetical protein